MITFSHHSDHFRLAHAFIGVGDFLGERYFGDLMSVKNLSGLMKLMLTEEKILDSPAGQAAQDSEGSSLFRVDRLVFMCG